MLKFLTFLCLLYSALVQAQDPLQTDLSLAYLAQIPDPAADRPLVILLHGFGSNEVDLFALKERLPSGYNYLAVRAPLELQPGRYKWFTQKPDEPGHDQDRGTTAYDGVTDELKASGERLATFIRQATQKYRTQPDKVYLVGFSQGAMMSYEVALRDPSLVGGFAALSGRLLPVLESGLKPGTSLAPLKVFIAHGAQDRQVAYRGGTHAEAFLRTLGLEPEFHGYQGLEHSISAAETAELARWLGSSLGNPR